MKTELTRRQSEFLNQFLDACQSLDEPIHYTDLAEKLNIGRITAYEMLRLLEKRGYVKSEFHLPADVRGPGRSIVCFKPTPKALLLIKGELNEAIEMKDWELVKERIFRRLREEKAEGYEELLNDLLLRIPGRTSPLIFMTEMITATILALASAQEYVKGKGLLDRLKKNGFPSEIALITVAGIGAVLSLLEDVNLSLAKFLLEQSKKYEDIFAQLSAEMREGLTDFARDVVNIVQS